MRNVVNAPGTLNTDAWVSACQRHSAVPGSHPGQRIRPTVDRLVFPPLPHSAVRSPPRVNFPGGFDDDSGGLMTANPGSL